MGISQGKRKACYRRDGHRCVKCGSPDNLTCDHIIPRSLGGKNHLRNLQTMCKSCNEMKGATMANYTKSKRVASYLASHWRAQ